ncbi:MAG: FAD:protein FMN transferase [bacterium]
MRRIQLFFICLLFLFSCKQASRQEPYTKSRFLMDTYVRISVYDKIFNKNRVEIIVDSALSVMQMLEKKLSAYYRDSEIYTVNLWADKKWINVSRPVSDCLYKCLEMSRLSSGNFDISIGVIKQHWCFNPDSAVIPDSLLIKELLPKVDYKKIALQNRKIRFKKSGMKIDLGGAAKGYIIDSALAFLEKEKIDSVIIEGGGDFRISGNHPERHQWRIGVRHPRKRGMKTVAVIETKATGFATSGDYERFFFKNGVRYHHLLDPETGYPAQHTVSVTIKAETAFRADAIATAVFIMGPEAGMDFIEDLDSIEGLIIYENSKNELMYKKSQGFAAKINL